VDELRYGRITYQMMEFWRPIARGELPEGISDWMVPFARVIDVAKKHVVSDTLPSVDWNADLIRGAGLREAVEALKAKPGKGIMTGGVTLPTALARMGLIDEYMFVVMPRIAGHGPYLMAGLSEMVDLKLVDRQELKMGAVVLRYVPR
jgi:dihydrofolate reductase